MSDEERSSLDILAAIGVEPEVVEEEVVVEDEVDGGSEEVEVPEVEAGDEEAGEPVVPEATPEPELILGKYKTADDLANAYKELERRHQETAERAAGHERYLQLLQEQENTARFDPAQPTNLDELVALSYERPDDAFWFAAENAPRQLAHILSEIRSYDPQKAEELQLDYNQQLIQTQLQQVQNRPSQADPMVEARTFAGSLHQTIASLPNYEAVKNEIAEMLRSRQNLISMDNPEASRQVMLDVYELASLKHQRKIEASDTARRLKHDAAAGSSAGVETGGHTGAPVEEDENPADVLRNAITAQANASAW